MRKGDIIKNNYAGDNNPLFDSMICIWRGEKCES